MPTFHRPGVYVQEQTLAPAATGVNAGSIGALIGIAAQGKTTPVLIDSWSKFVTLYGGFVAVTGVVPELAYGVYNFFAAGGKSTYVLRVVGSGSAFAICALTDGAATPQTTVTLTAISPGAWGNTLTASAADRDAANGRFDLTIFLNAVPVERYFDVSVSPTDSRYVVSLINAITGGSQYVTAANNSSATAAPANRVVQASPKVFAGGLDGAAPGTTDYQAAVPKFDVVTVPLMFAIPGNTTTAVQTTVISYCDTRTDCIFIPDVAAGLDSTGAVAAFATLTASSRADAYWPRVYMVDPNGSGPTQLRLSPVSGSVIGLYDVNDATRGVWKTPAGLSMKIPGAVALERDLTNADLDTLNDGNVNAIKVSQTAGGIILYGGRTLKKTAADRFINVRRTLIYVEAALNEILSFAVFENNDARLWSQASGRVSSFLTSLWAAGGLKGTTAQQAFYVIADTTNNTQQTIDTGIFNTTVGLALQQPAEFVVLTIGQWTAGGA